MNSSSLPFEKKLVAVQGIARSEVLSARKLEELYRVVYGNEVYSLLRRGEFGPAAELLSRFPVVPHNRSFLSENAKRY